MLPSLVPKGSVTWLQTSPPARRIRAKSKAGSFQPAAENALLDHVVRVSFRRAALVLGNTVFDTKITHVQTNAHEVLARARIRQRSALAVHSSLGHDLIVA